MRYLLLVIAILFFGCKEEKQLEQFNCGRCAAWESCNIDTESCELKKDACDIFNCGDYAICSIQENQPTCSCETGYRLEGIKSCVIDNLCLDVVCKEWQECDPDNGACTLGTGRCLIDLQCISNSEKTRCDKETKTCMVPYPSSNGCHPFEDSCVNEKGIQGVCYTTTISDSKLNSYCFTEQEIKEIELTPRGHECDGMVRICERGNICSDQGICQEATSDINGCASGSTGAREINSSQVSITAITCNCKDHSTCKEGTFCDSSINMCRWIDPKDKGCPEGLNRTGRVCLPIDQDQVDRCNEIINATYFETENSCLPNDCSKDDRCVGYSQCDYHFSLCFEEEPSLSRMAIGAQHICVINEMTGVTCWGSDSASVGIPEDHQGETIAQIAYDEAGENPLLGAISVVAGATHTCALTDDNNVYCWGDNGHSQIVGIINGDTEPEILSKSHIPFLIPLPETYQVEQLVAGENFTCTLGHYANLDSQHTLCWGRNTIEYDESGVTLFDYSEPKAVQFDVGQKQVKWITAWGNMLCGIDTDHKLHCNDLDKIPLIETNYTIDNNIALALVSFGREHGCIVNKAGQLYCSGSSYMGQLGSGSDSSEVISDIPGALVENVNITPKLISTGASHTCVSDGKVVYCWGNNDYQQIGDIIDPETESIQYVVSEPYLSFKTDSGTITQLVSGDNANCVLVVDQTDTPNQWYCWGGFLSSNGETIPNGNPTLLTIPVP